MLTASVDVPRSPAAGELLQKSSTAIAQKLPVLVADRLAKEALDLFRSAVDEGEFEDLQLSPRQSEMLPRTVLGVCLSIAVWADERRQAASSVYVYPCGKADLEVVVQTADFGRLSAVIKQNGDTLLMHSLGPGQTQVALAPYLETL